MPTRLNPRQSNVKSVYRTHIDAIHFRKTDEKRLHDLDEQAEEKLFTEERVRILRELAAKPDVYERLSSALAPSIYEHEDIKKVSPTPSPPRSLLINRGIFPPQSRRAEHLSLAGGFGYAECSFWQKSSARIQKFIPDSSACRVDNAEECWGRGRIKRKISLKRKNRIETPCSGFLFIFCILLYLWHVLF